MNDQNTPEAKPETTVVPTSMMSLGNLNILIFRKTTGAHEEHLLNIKRTPAPGTDDDPASIPVHEVPALIAMLEQVVPPAIALRSLTPPVPPITKKNKKGKK